MTKNERIGHLISLFGVIGVILSILIGFLMQSNAINNQWGQEFYKQRMNMYIKASDAAAQIAYYKKIDPNSQKYINALNEFKILYGGPMAILEGVDVETAMIKFDNALIKEVENDDLKNMAIFLSHILRNEARKNFDKNTPDSRYGNNEQLLINMENILNKY